MVVFGVAGDVGAYVVEGEFAAGGLGGVEEGEGEVGEAFEVVVARYLMSSSTRGSVLAKGSVSSTIWGSGWLILSRSQSTAKGAWW